MMVFAIAVGLRVAGLTVGNLVTLNAWAVVLVYGVPMGAILVAAWAAHVRMSPELRSKLVWEPKLLPAISKMWAERGMRGT
jgi:lipopolysaccharide export system permease protein